MKYSNNSSMTGSKIDYARQKQNKLSALSVDTEPLFPRLHVSEAERHGSKGPPRNRMALYEHLTIPSHRFVHKSAQNQQFTSNGCALVPQFVKGVHAFAQSSYGASTNDQEMLLPSMTGDSRSVGLSSCISRLDSDDLKEKMDEKAEDYLDENTEKACGGNGGVTKKAKACDVHHASVSIFTEEGNQLKSRVTLQEPKLHNDSNREAILQSPHSEDSSMANESQPSPACADKHVFRPKDVMRQIGQPHFWKARKVLLRQQRIFSDQVFQLHRLIKVQQLLAETPGTFIDDKENETGPINECNTTQLTKLTNENIKGSIKEKTKDQGTATKASLTSGMKVRSISPFPVSNSSATWGYPNMGPGQWMTPVTPQTYPMYHPIAGHFLSGFCHSGFYGYPTTGSVSPGIPISFPQSVGNYGAIPQPADASKNDPTKGLGRIPPGCLPYQYPGSWYAYPDYHASNGQTLHSDCSINAASTISSISTNNQHSSTIKVTVQSANIVQQSMDKPNTLQQSMNKPTTMQQSMNKPTTMQQSMNKPTTTQQSMNKKDLLLEKGVPDNSISQIENVSQSDDICKDRRPHEQPNEVDQMSSGTGQLDGDKDGHESITLELFPTTPERQLSDKQQSQVIKVIPRSAMAASQSAAGILLSLQHERQQHSLSCV